MRKVGAFASRERGLVAALTRPVGTLSHRMEEGGSICWAGVPRASGPLQWPAEGGPEHCGPLPLYVLRALF